MPVPSPSAPAPARRSAPWPVGAVLLGLAIGWQLVLSAQSYFFLSYQVLAADDAFYYFKIVRNLVHLGWSTFDGLHQASGVQLLWSVLLVPFAWAIDDRMLFVRAVMVLCAAFNLYTGLALRRLATRLHSPLVGECAAAAWAVVLMVWLTPTLTGMEYPLHTAIIVTTLLVWWPLVVTPAAATPGQVTWLAVLLTLNFWTRLDSAFYSSALGAIAALRLWLAPGGGAARTREIATLVAAPAVGGVAYLGTCYLMAGTITPISGVVKSLYASRYFAGQPASTIWRERVEWWMQIQAQPVVDLVATPFGFEAWTLRDKLVCLAIGLGLALWGAWRAWGADRQRAWSLGLLVAVLLALGAGHVALVISSIAHFSYVTRHYYGWMQVAWCLWFAYLVAQALEALGATARRAVVSVAVVGVITAQVMAVVPRFEPFSEKELRHGRWLAMQWADAHLPPGAKIGAWNAGQVAYFLDRPVVNLDGLVNDAAYVEVLRGDRTLLDYLQAEGIEYLMDYNDVDLSMPYHAYWKREQRFRNALDWRDLTVLHVQPAADTAVQVLKVTPGAGSEPPVGVAAAP